MKCHELEVSVIYRVNKLVFGVVYVLCRKFSCSPERF